MYIISFVLVCFLLYISTYNVFIMLANSFLRKEVNLRYKIR